MIENSIEDSTEELPQEQKENLSLPKEDEESSTYDDMTIEEKTTEKEPVSQDIPSDEKDREESNVSEKTSPLEEEEKELPMKKVKSSPSFETKNLGGIKNTEIEKEACSIKMIGTGNALSIEASIAPQYTQNPYYYVFGKLFVDGEEVKDFTYQTSIPKQTISLSQFSTGYHTAFLQVYNQNTRQLVDLIYESYIPYNGIKDRPGYRGKFDVYHNYFTFFPYNMAMQNQAGNLYLEYSSNGGKTWNRYGYMKANAIKLYIDQSYKIGGLKPNTVYKTRLRYGIYATYPKELYGDGKSHFFGGPVLASKTIKTGKAKSPQIKSVKVKAVKVKYHKVKHYGKYTHAYLYTEKFYTCKFKVTVKLKKKPGAKGIWINGHFVKGNKKTYTTTFTPYPNYFSKKPPKRLKKYKLGIASYQDKAYGGYSPLKVKKVKIK